MSKSEKFDENNIAKSVFQKNYDQLPESKQEILDQKYNCSICLELIKYENPFLCYECQKIFHHSCLKNWDTRERRLGKKCSCPNCRNELPFEEWKVLRNYDENRAKDALLLNQIGQSFDSNEFVEKSINLFKLILNKLNNIHSFIQIEKHYKLNNLIEEFKSDLIHPKIDDISKAVIDELDLLEEYISKINQGVKKDEIIYKNEINIKYMTQKEGTENIFGKYFVENNIKNINLIINGKQSPLVHKCNLKKGENNVTICLQNNLTNLSYMFCDCEALNNIDELRYLNTENVSDFSYMFEKCKISNIIGLETWNTSKAETFHSMFSCCELITNLNPLKIWNVSKCDEFSYMFYGCKNLSDIKGLRKWNVSNGINFAKIFSRTSVSDIKPLEKWDFSNAKDLYGFFCECKHLTDISPVKNWNMKNVKNLREFFSDCEKLSDITPIKDWDVSNVRSLCYLFYGSENISDITPMKNWNISKCKDLKGVFGYCRELSDISSIKDWNVSNVKDFSSMFKSCSSITDLKPLENWDVSSGEKFEEMFSGCKSLKNQNILKKWKFPKNSDFQSMFNN